MFVFESDYWWYRGLHELVEYYVNKVRKQKQQNHEENPIRIFDAGCGTGRLMELLSKHGTVTGIDYAEEAVTFCRQRGIPNVSVADLNQWRPEPGAYHIVVSNDVLCNSGVEDDAAVIEKFNEALVPGGHLILNLPAFKCLCRKHDIAVFGKRRYRKKKTTAMLKEMGFDVVAANYRLPALFLVIILQKYLIESFQKDTEATSDLKTIPKGINKLLLFLNRIENRIIRMGIPQFFGSSLFLVCRKKNVNNGVS